MTCLLCHGTGLLWSSRLRDKCPLCEGDPSWLADMHPVTAASVGSVLLGLAACLVPLEMIEQLCSVGTAGETVERQMKALAGAGAKQKNAKHARETLDILIAGHYIGPGGSLVDVSHSLCAAVSLSKYLPASSWEKPASSGIRHKLSLEVRCCTTLAAAQDLASSMGVAPGVLNFASARNPGGGFLTGAVAQEESLARSSGIYPCLSKHFDAFFAPSRRAASGLYTHDMIYSPKVPVIRDERGTLLDEPYLVDFLTAAAPNCGVLKGRYDAHKAALQCSDALYERIRRVLHTFAASGCVDIVLGAWGCGVFGNDPSTMARLFGDALAEFQCFRRVVFAVLDPKMARTFGEEMNFTVEGLPVDRLSPDPQEKPSKRGKEQTKPVSRKEAHRRKGAHHDDN